MKEGRGNPDLFLYREIVKSPVSKPEKGEEGSFLALSY